MRPNILKRIFWDPNRAFVGTNFHYIGLPAVLQMSKKIVLAPAVIFGTLFTFEYLLVPSTYYDEYDGTASEFITTPSK